MKYDTITAKERQNFIHVFYGNVNKQLKEKGYSSAAEFARKAGIKPAELQAWLHSKSVPRLDRIIFFLKNLEVSADDLLSGLY